MIQYYIHNNIFTFCEKLNRETENILKSRPIHIQLIYLQLESK